MAERLFLRLDEDALHGPEADIPAGTLRAWPVSEPLRGHVAHILQYREVIPSGSEVVERVVPDGAVRLVLNIGSAPKVEGHAGRPAEVIGASATPVVVRMRGTVEGLSITLRPGAAAALFGVPAGELAEQTVPLDELWPDAAAELRDRLAGSAADARVDALQAALRRRLVERGESVHPGAAHAARIIAMSGGRTPLRDVADSIGIGERRLQQLFQAHVGLSPRAWSRLARLHSCLRQLRRSVPPAWAEVAVESGFYDQSHLVNEFRALCGMTPTEFLSRSISRSSKTTA